MDSSTYLAFVLATTALILLPGPSILLTVGQGLAHGFRLTLASIAGTSLAIVFQLLLVAVGMTSFMLALAEWFEWLRWAGVAYLAYLSFTLWRAEASPSLTQSRAVVGRFQLFWQGFLVSGSNPKSLLFYGAFFPQFLQPGPSQDWQMLILGVTFLAIAATLTTLYAALAHRVRPYLDNPQMLRSGNRMAALAMLCAAVALALARVRQ